MAALSNHFHGASSSDEVAIIRADNTVQALQKKLLFK